MVFHSPTSSSQPVYSRSILSFKMSLMIISAIILCVLIHPLLFFSAGIEAGDIDNHATDSTREAVNPVPAEASPAADAEAPTTPTGITAMAVSSSQVEHGWALSRDNVQVTGYGIYDDDFSNPGSEGYSNGYAIAPAGFKYSFDWAEETAIFGDAPFSGRNVASAGTYSISGAVTYNGIGISGVAMSLFGAATAMVMTDSYGNYAFGNLPNGNYAVTPTKAGFPFAPENKRVAVIGDSRMGIDFVVTEPPPTYSIFGTATLHGVGLADVSMILSGSASALAGTGTDGEYIFPDLGKGSYTVKPYKPGYIFVPEERQVTVDGADFSAGGFIASTPGSSYSISGTVTYNGNGLSNVTMRLSGAASAMVITDKYGSYIFPNVPNGSYIISPRKSPYAIRESAVTVNGAHRMDVNFNAAYRGCSCEALSENSVSISVPSGVFTNTFYVNLLTSISGAQIRYTTNGQNPSASSNLYTGAINITSTTRLIAAAFVGETMWGLPSTAIYIKMDPAFQATIHDLPVVILDSYGNATLPTVTQYIDVAYLAFDPDDNTNGTVILSPAAAPTPSSASLASAHNRGNSSTLPQFPKRSYRLELRDETGEDRDCPMFGMPEDADWALIAPYTDKTLIHNNFVYGLGRDMGIPAPRIKLVEVYVNTGTTGLSNSHYQGIYQLAETIKDSKNRLNLKQLHADAPDDSVFPKITGGYIFKFEFGSSEPPELKCPNGASNCWNYLDVVDPNDWPDKDKFANATPPPAYLTHPQYLYLQNHIKTFNDMMNGPNLTDPATGYPVYMDERSFIDHIIIDELMRNGDAYTKSQYFYKQRDKSGETAKIFAGPLWDFDLTAGMGFTANGIDSTAATGSFQYDAMEPRFTGLSPYLPIGNWFPKLFNLMADMDSDFSKHFRARWNTLRQPGGLLSDSVMDARIDALAAGLAAAASRNFEKWNILNAQYVPSPWFKTPQTSTWQEQIPLMKIWLHDRAAWLDGQWLP